MRMPTLPLLALLALCVPTASAGPFESLADTIWGVTDPMVECTDNPDCYNPCADGCNPCQGQCPHPDDVCEADEPECGDGAAANIFDTCGTVCDDPTTVLWPIVEYAGENVDEAEDDVNGMVESANQTAADASHLLDPVRDAYGTVRALTEDLPGTLDQTAPEQVLINCQKIWADSPLGCWISVTRETDFGFIPDIH